MFATKLTAKNAAEKKAETRKRYQRENIVRFDENVEKSIRESSTGGYCSTVVSIVKKLQSDDSGIPAEVVLAKKHELESEPRSFTVKIEPDNEYWDKMHITWC